MFNYFKNHKTEAIILTITLVILMWAGCTLIINTGWSFLFDSESIDHFGSFMGGLATFIGIYYLFMTLRSQNESFQIQNFESKFIELIKFNREMVSPIKIINSYESTNKWFVGKDVFGFFNHQIEDAIDVVSTFICGKELSSLYNNINQYNADKALWSDALFQKRTIINIAYLIAFFGVKSNGYLLLKNKYLIQYNPQDIDNLLKEFRLKLVPIDPLMELSERNPLIISKILASDNKLFIGFQNELGNYFRTLFQCVSFVNKQNFIKYSDKYDYVKMLRGQLSNVEESVLFYNSISDIGLAWEYLNIGEQDFNNQLITKYNIVKNIPDNLTRFPAIIFYPQVSFEYMPDTSSARYELEKKYK